ncbi:hypothetical protein ACPA9J_05405 [Pseudomonas aeruginosa]
MPLACIAVYAAPLFVFLASIPPQRRPLGLRLHRRLLPGLLAWFVAGGRRD